MDALYVWVAGVVPAFRSRGYLYPLIAVPSGSVVRVVRITLGSFYRHAVLRGEELRECQVSVYPTGRPFATASNYVDSFLSQHSYVNFNVIGQQEGTLDG